MLIKAGGAARRRRHILRSEEVDHQAALLGRMKMIRVMMRMMRMRKGRMEVKMRIKIGMRRSEEVDHQVALLRGMMMMRKMMRKRRKMMMMGTME